MFRYLKNVRISLDVPAPVAVGGVLFVAALTKGGHPQWAIAGLIILYAVRVLHLAIQNSTRSTDVRAQPLGANGL